MAKGENDDKWVGNNKDEETLVSGSSVGMKNDDQLGRKEIGKKKDEAEWSMEVERNTKKDEGGSGGRGGGTWNALQLTLM